MAVSKKPKALSDSHMRAIGRVAAQWADLEFTLLWFVAKTVKVDFKHAVILAGAQNATAWCEMLRKLTNPSHKPGTKRNKTAIDEISVRITDLLALRNEIVHNSWTAPSGTSIISGAQVPSPKVNAKYSAEGLGIPKRGSKLFNFTNYTSREILKVAADTRKVELDLYTWWELRQKTNRLAELLRSPSPSNAQVQNPGLLGGIASLAPALANAKLPKG